jgi:hypothetical protein
MTLNIWLILTIAITATIISLYFGTKSNYDTHTYNIHADSKDIEYINPSPFKTGYLKNPDQNNANLCGGSGYPLKQPYVDYGDSISCSDCDNLKFNSAP